MKLAAMEGQFLTQRGAPLRIGGIPNEETRTTRYALEIPHGLSLLAYHDPQAVVRGLGDFAPEIWPPIALVHVAFQAMVGAGILMMAMAVWSFWTWRRGRMFESDRFLRALVWSSSLGFVALEAGWIVTEVGRQPWIIQGIMRTSEAVTPMPGLAVPFVAFTLLYLFLASVVVWLLLRQFKETDA